MVTKVVPGLLIATPDAAQAAREAAARMARAIRDALKERGEATIALSGGTSPGEAYKLLAAETIDWKKVQIFWVDERAVPASHERSNFGNAKEFLALTHAPESNIHRMPGENPDLEAAAASYESLLRDTVKSKLGGLPALDLVVLGIGDDGHTASLFPNEKTVHITDKLVAAVKSHDGLEPRLTLTAPMLENARASVIIVLGAKKHPALERIWATNGSIDETPARVIRSFRGSICWVIDRAAGGMG